jgi:hypothetical protein
MRRLSAKNARLDRTTSTRTVYTKPLSSIVKSPSADDLRSASNPIFSVSPIIPSPPVGPSPRVPNNIAAVKAAKAALPHSVLSSVVPRMTIEQRAHAEMNERAKKCGVVPFVPKSSDDANCFDQCMHCGKATKCKAQASLMVFPEEDYVPYPYITCYTCEKAAEIARVKELVDYMAVPLRVTYLDSTVVKTDHGLAHIFNVCWLESENQYVVDLKSQDFVFMRSLYELKAMNPRLLETLRKIVFWPEHYPQCLREHFIGEVQRYVGTL